MFCSKKIQCSLQTCLHGSRSQLNSNPLDSIAILGEHVSCVYQFGIFVLLAVPRVLSYMYIFLQTPHGIIVILLGVVFAYNTTCYRLRFFFFSFRPVVVFRSRLRCNRWSIVYFLYIFSSVQKAQRASVDYPTWASLCVFLYDIVA